MKTGKSLILLAALSMLAACSQQPQMSAPAEAPTAQAPSPAAKVDTTPGIPRPGEQRLQALSVSGGIPDWQTITPTQDWIPPGTTKLISSTDPSQVAGAGPGDDVSKQLQFPGGFVFPFFGQNKTSAWISTNGLISFDAQNASYTNTDLATVASSFTGPEWQNVLAVYWDDLELNCTSTNTGVFYKTVGTAPNRQLVISFVNESAYTTGCGNTGDFQAVLYETSGKVVYKFRDTNFDAGTPISGNPTGGDFGATATVGLKSGSKYAQFSHNEARVTNQLAIAWTPGSAPMITLSLPGGATQVVGSVPASIAYNVAASDPDSQPLNLTCTLDGNAISGEQIGNNTLNAGAGDHALSCTVTDPTGLSASATANFTVRVNVAPTAPGAPALTAGNNPNNTGAFTLGWTASTDADNDTLKYTLQGRDADDSDWGAVQGNLTTNSHALTAVSEGTWTYRAKANDGTVDSAYSPASAAIKVDKSAPTAPAASFVGTLLNGWYKDSASVSFAGSSDPALADTSDGSGVTSYQGAQTFSTSGTHSYSGTARDAAGNTSAATTGSVQVDATPPTVAFSTCPTAPVLLNSIQSAAWTASDAHSGLASQASGSETLPTSSVGDKSVSVTATDKVGHTTSASCAYKVIYDFRGFFSPVDNLPTVNTVKAGSSVPVKFSLNGNQGLGILAAGYPRAVAVSCLSGTSTDEIEQTVTANTGLTYDASTDTYNYVWKTSRTPGCVRLEVRLSDGTDHNALFKLR